MRTPLTLTFAVLAVAFCGGGDWLQFRGNDSSGVALDTDLATNWKRNDFWNTQKAWEADLPGKGASSPIVVSGRVIVTCSSGAKQDRLHVLAFDQNRGKLLWERKFWATGRTFCDPSSAVAANTPASDGQRIYALFSSNDMVCLDLDGNLQWFRGLALDHPKAGNDFGMSSSPLVVGETVIVQIESQSDSFAAGLNFLTGETRWEIERAKQANWSSPIIVLDPTLRKKRVALQSTNGLSVHDPRTGEEFWNYPQPCEAIPSSVAVNDVLYVPSHGMTALKSPAADGKPEVLWSESRLSPSACSPVVHEGRVYIINRAGVLVCGDAETGEVLWQLRLEGRFWATPIAAGKRLYLVNSDGVAQVVALGEKGELIAKSELGETIQGTPAVANGSVFVRSNAHLWNFTPR